MPESHLAQCVIRKTEAIVTEIAGTTRDTLEEQIMLGDLSYFGGHSWYS